MTTPTTCLVVDDSRVVRKVARRILEAAGFTVTEAPDGQSALAQCRTSLPGCVLLDWNMPVMNGLEFLRGLRAEYGPGGPAVVLCTTQTERAVLTDAMQAGAQGYLTKPFDSAILTKTFRQLGLL